MPRSCAEKYHDAIRVLYAPYLYSNMVSSFSFSFNSPHPIPSIPPWQVRFVSDSACRWYNTTYALYGSMILLHLVLSNYPDLPDDDLLADVEKSLEIFESMDDIIVARRCAVMLREVLDVARTCLVRRRGENGLLNGRGSGVSGQIGSGSGPVDKSSVGEMLVGITSYVSSSSSAATAPASASSTMGTSLPGMQVDVPLGYGSDTPALPPDNTGAGAGEALASRSTEEDFFFSLFSQDPQQPADRTRTEMLANLVDPSILEDFAFGGHDDSFF